ncbi:MAG: DeoR/GlpR family DNA-binding transcription regulator [Nocardioidaceae bacterium]
MTRYERLNALLEVLADEGHMGVAELADRWNVSQATIRRDLDHLAGQQMITRTRGGALANSVADLPIRYKSARHASEKQRIGRVAAEIARPGMTIAINGGTTTSEVARALAQRSDLINESEGQRLTLVTNAVNIANEMAIRQHIKLVVVGGVARPQSYELIGPLAHHTLEELTFDLAFLGVDGISLDRGATTHHEGEAEVNRLLACQAHKVVVVADGSKLGKAAFARICRISEIDVLVTTEESAPASELAELQGQDMEVLRS